MSIAGGAAHAASYPQKDANGYLSQFDQPVILPGDTCTDDRRCHSVPSCDVTFSPSTPQETIEAELNGSDGDRTFCFRPGDYRSHGSYRITTSGTAAERRWMRLAGDGDLTHPVQLAESARARMPKVQLDGADYWVVHRLYWDMNNAAGSLPLLEFMVDSGARNNLVDRVLMQRAQPTTSRAFIDIRRSNNDNIVQNSVIRRAKPRDEAEAVGVRVWEAYDNRIVNNEIYDVSKAIFLFGGGSSHTAGTIIENNDFYVTAEYRTDCNGNTSAGRCAFTRSIVSLKRGGTQSSPVRIIHNRLWGNRYTDNAACCLSGSQGELLTISNDSSTDTGQADWVLVLNNIFFDSQKGIAQTRNGNRNISVIGNIFYNHRDFRQSSNSVTYPFALANLDYSEVYLNTVVGNERWGYLGGGFDYGDVRCNVFVDNGNSPVNGLGASSTMQHNAWYATRAFSTGSGDVCDGGSSCGAADARHESFCFKRKLLTSPGEYCIPNARPTQDSPHYRACPAGGSADAIGQRTGIGVNDDAID